MSRPFFKSGIIGILLIISSLALLKVFPSQAPRLPDGFFTPILAFEFVNSRQEVENLFGEPQSAYRAAMVTAMDLGNRLDYAYMILYSLFLFGFSITCARLTQRRRYYFAALISILVLIGDAMENVQLLGITRKLADGGYEKELQLLFYFTWLKWGGLALIFLILVPYFFKGSLIAKLIALIGLTTVVLAILSFLNRSVLNEIYSLSVAVMFLVTIIYALTHRHRKRIML
ncbi:MAG: hypothetical protein HN580_26330 [Deltaproteobacteria bacterium]|jgi:hypothetical protein|nr:hypothetical protein [Deltaproteobacteria bacterium]MBT4641134.1 hypothetical protein [Deltaproteobacteria bacterium]MBT6504984.1 hypothetical protein [Deltaproteobacteria bacterium]MBT6610794.1 hypothetical protein [Deltaproteobacteria bacterium]MBT7153967.1 hypothetical protein [Deltaproteobacteria bacterium]